MISYAQNFEDVMLARAFGDRGRGFYIDIGACFPDVASVTKHFYDRGWNGINVEPMAEPFALLVAERARDVNLNIAIAGYSGDIPIYPGPSVGESSAVRPDANVLPLLVPCLTLADLCRQYAMRPIDFIKIDVEGLERDVVLGGDWDAFRPAVVVIEVTTPWTTNRRPESIEITQYLAAKGYCEIYFDGLNAFYLAREAGEKATQFSSPPNVLDRFMPWREKELAASTELARQEVQVLTSAAAAADVRGREAESRAQQAAAREREVAVRAERAESRARDAERRAEVAEADVQQTAMLLDDASARALAADEQSVRVNAELATMSRQFDAAILRAIEAERNIQLAAAKAHDAETRAASAEARARHADSSFAAIERSNSWRLTAPLRWLRARTRVVIGGSVATSQRPSVQSERPMARVLRKSLRVAKRSNVYARIAPLMRERYPKLWFRAKRMLLDRPAPAAPAPLGPSQAASPSRASETAPVNVVQPEASRHAMPGSRSITVEELKDLIEQEVIRQRRS